MRYYGSIEEANKEARQRVKDYRTAAGYIPTVCRILNGFDNKVYNCRLDKALEAATGNRVHADKTDYSLEVYTYPEHGCSYRITLARVDAKELPDNKRIPADKLIDSAREHRESILRKAYNLETSIDQVPQIKAYIEETKKKLEAYVRSFPDDLRDLYGLPYYIRLD